MRRTAPAINSREEEEEVKREYKKPQVVKVNLKVEQTVLGGCKMEGVAGPNGDPCPPVGCSDVNVLS